MACPPDYAAGHIPGSLAIPLREAFATWLGWLVPDPATPLVVVADPGQDLSEVIWQALKIGYENLAGALAGGMPAWQAAGHSAAATPLLTPGQVDPAAVIDVRQASEYADGHPPGATGPRRHHHSPGHPPGDGANTTAGWFFACGWLQDMSRPQCLGRDKAPSASWPARLQCQLSHADSSFRAPGMT